MDTLILLTLLLIHIGGAIVGFGPTFTFAILGPMAGSSGPNGVLILEAVVAIVRRLVLPVAAVTQPLSGLALIFVGGWAQAFLSHYWLWIGILVYAAAFYLAIFVQTPTIERMIALAKAGPPGPELKALAARTQRVGPITTVLLAVVIFLMIVKPGG